MTLEPTRAVALLRGINVGGHNKLAMADLRASLTQAGFADVETYIQSGNVAFTIGAETGHGSFEQRISAVIAEDFGYDLPVVVRTAAQIAAAVEANPFPDAVAVPKWLLVFFCDVQPSRDAVAAFDHSAFLPDRFALGVTGTELYVAYDDGVHSSKLDNKVIERHLGVTTTARNWSTVVRLAEMAEGVER